MQLLAICLGGALGSGARFLLSGWAVNTFGPAFPYGTLAVNVLGSLLLGVVAHVGLETSLLSPTLRLALTTGVLGGFTTYSTFNHETLRYVQEGASLRAIAYVVATLGLCLLAGLAGMALGRRLVGG